MVLSGKLTREEATKIFLKLYTSATVPNWLEELLGNLILIDEPEEHAGLSEQELKQITQKLRERAKTQQNQDNSTTKRQKPLPDETTD
ncbi:MAG: hypothetical protein DRJ40_02650 [Thermoprotei archaeon]|nr:MAG: hypothetical protein DRJ40_02650 [Thermoprotei archaeon]